MATLTLTESTNFRPDPPELDIDTLVFAETEPQDVTATFHQNQFGPGLISNSLSVHGGIGRDEVYIAGRSSGSNSTNGIDISGWTFTDWSAVDLITLVGSDQKDVIRGSSMADHIISGIGYDTLRGEGGNDTIVAAGAGTLYGGADDDSLTGGFNATLRGEAGNDTIATGGDGYGGEGNDSLTGTGQYNTYLYGEAGSDTLVGGDHGNELDGGTGDDRLIGGAGDDYYYLDSAGDEIVETGASGADTVFSKLSFSFEARPELENLHLTVNGLTGTGNAGANIMTARQSSTLYGLGGNDSLTAGLASTLVGGDGDDLYDIREAPNALVTEEAGIGSGIDTVWTRANNPYTLPDNFENLILRGEGTAYGNAADNVMTTDNTSGALVIFHGGAGNDTYYVSNASVTIVEAAGEGIDSVISTRNTAITLWANVENITAMAPIVRGNELDNAITGSFNANNLSGNVGNDTISGLGGNDTLDGGVGNDTLAGGLGNDLYRGVDASDTIVEEGGIDTIESASNILLADFDSIENLTLIGRRDLRGEGTAEANHIRGNEGDNLLKGWGGPDDLKGGQGDDSLRGGDGKDTLSGSFGEDRIFGDADNDLLQGMDGDDALFGGDGNDTLMGGAGADTMNGGLGNDRYQYVEGGDTIVEVANGGIDRVIAYGSLVLADNVEDLTLDLSGDATGEGNGLANRIVAIGGTSTDNILLKGWGGNDTIVSGNTVDTLRGGDGDDSLVAGNGNDVLYGEAGNDQSHGGFGADLLNAGDGDDVLRGEDGNDTLVGGAGNDTMRGGAGADIFRFAASGQGADRIADFSLDADRFDLATGQSFTAFSEGGGNTTLTYAGGTVVVLGVTGLALAGWNDRVLPDGGNTAATQEPISALSAWHAIAARLQSDLAHHGHDYFFA